MSAYLVLLAVVLSTAVLVGLAHLVRTLRVPAEDRRAAREQAPGARPAPRDWEPLQSRFLPALLALATVAIGLPLLLWGLALHDPALRQGALCVGLNVVLVGAVGALHAWRRGEVLR